MFRVKRHMSGVFILLTAIILVVGTKLNYAWIGIVKWGLAAITLSLAMYYTKYIPSQKQQNNPKSGE